MESNQSNGAAVRAFRVLETVARHEDGCTLAQLVEALALPKQTVHRLVTQLEGAGLLAREPRGRRIQLGYRVEALGVGALTNGPGRRERHAILTSLCEQLGMTCNIAVLSGTDIVYLDRVETTWPLRLVLAPGSHVPLHATSSGKLLASLLPKAQRDRLLHLLSLRRFTEHTIVDSEALERELEETRKRRIGINRAEHVDGLCGVAVPVMLDRQRACAAVAIQGLQDRTRIEQLLACVPQLQQAAKEIGRTFGVRD